MFDNLLAMLFGRLLKLGGLVFDIFDISFSIKDGIKMNKEMDEETKRQNKIKN